MKQRVLKSTEWIVLSVAAALVVSMGLKVWTDVDPTYDSWYYHLPFAARLWGIIPLSEYQFENSLQPVFQGFPLLAEWVQGFFWKITGRVQGAVFCSFFSLIFCAGFFWKRLQCSAGLAFLALLSVPLIQAQAVSCYVDLPSAVFLAAGILEVFLLSEPPKNLFSGILKAGIFLAIAANIKYQAIPIAGLVWLIGIVFYARARDRAGRGWKFLLIFGLSLLIFYKPAENFLLFGNPFYPVKIKIGNYFPNYFFPGSQEQNFFYRKTPQWMVWLMSVFETTRSPFEKYVSHGYWVPWEVAQGAGDPAKSRMGGFFGAYVVFQLISLGWMAWALKLGRPAIRAAALLVGMSLITAVMPLSHELRYYMYWIIVLIGLNLWLLRQVPVRESWAPFFYYGGVLFFLGFVLWVTAGAYVFPASGSLEARMKYFGVNKLKQIDRFEKEGRGCVVKGRPLSLMYAHYFHPERKPYFVYAAESTEACRVYLERSEP